MKIHKHGKHIKTINTVIESCLIVILIVLVAIMMVLIGKLQGTARVINYTGLEVLLKEKSSLKSLVILMMSSSIILMEFLKILNIKMAIIILSNLITMIMKKNLIHRLLSGFY